MSCFAQPIQMCDTVQLFTLTYTTDAHTDTWLHVVVDVEYKTDVIMV